MFAELSATRQMAYMKELGDEAVEAAELERKLRDKAATRKNKLEVRRGAREPRGRARAHARACTHIHRFTHAHATALFLQEAESELERLVDVAKAAKLAADKHRIRLARLKESCAQEEAEDEEEGRETRERWTFLSYLK